MAPLPVLNTITSAYGFIWEDKEALIRIAALPVVALALAGTLLDILLPAQPLPMPSEDGTVDPADIPINFGSLLQALLTLCFYVMFAVAWHRKWLLPSESVTVWSALRWEGRKTRFLFRLIGMSLLSFAGALPAAVVAVTLTYTGLLPIQLGTMMIVVALLLTFARLALIFPATAVDDVLSVKDCWLLTRKNGLRMLIIVVAPALPITILQILVLSALFAIDAAAELFGTLTGAFALSLLQQAFSYAGIAVGVTALSISYDHFRQQAAGGTGGFGGTGGSGQGWGSE